MTDLLTYNTVCNCPFDEGALIMGRYTYNTQDQSSEYAEKVIGFNLIAAGMSAWAIFRKWWVIPVTIVAVLIVTAITYKRKKLFKVVTVFFSLFWGGVGWVIGKQIAGFAFGSNKNISISIGFAIFWLIIGIILNAAVFKWFDWLVELRRRRKFEKNSSIDLGQQ